jgi:hypothetical protein
MTRSVAVALASAGSMALACALTIAFASCDSGSPASPVGLSPPPDAGVEETSAALCPPGMDASWGSIYTQLIGTPGCGSNNDSCHDSKARANTVSPIDYSLDAAAVYTEFLGDGGGAPAGNENHPSVQILRVKPFDADASMLYLKLIITSQNDPQYGAGMPKTAPGSVCPAAVAAVADWINGGAPNN